MRLCGANTGTRLSTTTTRSGRSLTSVSGWMSRAVGRKTLMGCRLQPRWRSDAVTHEWSGSHAHSDPRCRPWPGRAWLIWIYGHEGSGPYQSIFLDYFEKLAERRVK